MDVGSKGKTVQSRYDRNTRRLEKKRANGELLSNPDKGVLSVTDKEFKLNPCWTTRGSVTCQLHFYESNPIHSANQPGKKGLLDGYVTK